MDITKCKWCGSENLKFRARPDTPHYGEMICGHCNTHSHWVKNPTIKKHQSFIRNTKTIQEILNFHNMKEEFCFFCLRNKNQLGLNETLTIDHIQELDKGGEDQIWNMQILCSSCHKLKNWCRLYMNWHFKNGNDS